MLPERTRRLMDDVTEAMGRAIVEAVKKTMTTASTVSAACWAGLDVSQAHVARLGLWAPGDPRNLDGGQRGVRMGDGMSAMTPDLRAELLRLRRERDEARRIAERLVREINKLGSYELRFPRRCGATGMGAKPPNRIGESTWDAREPKADAARARRAAKEARESDHRASVEGPENHRTQDQEPSQD